MKLKAPVHLFETTPWSRLLQFSAFALLMFGIKLLLIGWYGNATPYWDQWDAEAAELYKPFFSDTLHFSDLVAPHNEHRIFTTRLLALTLISINKTWNPILQMVVNAGLHIFTLGYGISLLAKTVGRNYLGALFAFSLVLFCIPFGWENTLAGFQSQFYFVLFFTIASLWLIAFKEPFTLGWCGGVCCAILAFLSLGSGTYTIGTAAVMSLVIFMTNLRRTPRQLTAVTILFVLFIACNKLTPSVPGNEVLKAASFQQFLIAFNSIGSWPFSGGFFLSLIRNLPSLFFIIIMLSKPSRPAGSKWFLFAMVIWSVWEGAGLAYSLGANANLDSRYKDLFSFMILINFACLIWLVQNFRDKWKIPSQLLAGVWTLIVLISLMRWGYRELPEKLVAKHENSLAQEINTRNYLATGDINHLKNKQFLQIPYPDADRLAMILSWPEIRKILPGNINPGIKAASVQGNSDSVFIKNEDYTGPPLPAGRLDTLNNRLISHFYLFIMSGLVLVVLLIIKVCFENNKGISSDE